jgi:glycosyltransferase involved in cell wall biosynthesis
MIHFSVIIPTYNRASLIALSIESVLNQTFSNWELIVVDDGSSDNTKEIVDNYCQKDARIKYVYQENAERCVARNNGILHSKGEYICFLDSDDYYLSNRLELLAIAISNLEEKVAAFYTAIKFEERGEELFVKDPGPLVGNVFDYLYKAVIGTPQLCISKHILQKHTFDQKYIVGEDYELLNRIALEFPIIYLPNQTTVVACEHEGRTADLSSSYLKHIEMLEHVIRDIRPPFSSTKIPNIYRHDAYLGLARSYLHEGKKYKMLQIIFKASLYAPIHSFKEKCLLIVTSFLIFRPFIFIFKFFKK